MVQRIAAVTGASSGLGRDIACAFGEQGWSVGIGARRLERLEETADEIRKLGGKAAAFPLDVCDAGSVNAFFAEVTSTFEAAPDLVVVNAGAGVPGSIEDQDPEEIRSVVDTNLLGAAFCAKRALKAFAFLGRQADLVFISSESVERPVPHMLPYGMAKAAVEYLAEGLRIETAGRDIRITTLRLGPAMSEFGAGFDQERAIEMLNAWNAAGINMQGALLSGEQVAEAVLHAVSAPSGVVVRGMQVGPARPPSE